MKNRYLTCTINSGVAPDDIVFRTGNAALVSMDALSFRGVDADETYYSLRFRNKIVGLTTKNPVGPGSGIERKYAATPNQ